MFTRTVQKQAKSLTGYSKLSPGLSVYANDSALLRVHGVVKQELTK